MEPPPRRYRRYRYPFWRPPPPPPPVEPPVYEEVVEYGEGPLPPEGPPVPAPWARTVWFWLFLLGVVVVIGVIILLLATMEDDGRRERAALAVLAHVSVR